MSASDRDEALRELGRMGRERREDVGLSLEDIFERTRVRIEYLRGIEQGAYQGFPDLVYVKGFVRTYLGVIDAEDLKEEFMSWLNKDSKDRRIPPTNVLGNTPFPTKGFKLASHFGLFVVLLLALIGSGCYVWYSWANNVIVPRPFEPVQQSGLVSSDGSSADLTGALSMDNSFLSIVPVSASVVKEEPQPEIGPYLLLKANTDVWIKVTIAEKVVFTNTIKAGSEVSWDLPAMGKVSYGRANAATVILNGKELKNASAKGTYLYNPDGTFRKVQ